MQRNTIFSALATIAVTLSGCALEQDAAPDQGFNQIVSPDAEGASETGFDCLPACGQILCGGSATAVYEVELVDFDAGAFEALLVDHIGGVELEVESVAVLGRAGVELGGRGLIVALAYSDGTPMLAVADYFPFVEADGDLRSVECPWVEGDPVPFDISELEEANALGAEACFEWVSLTAPIAECGDDTPEAD